MLLPMTAFLWGSGRRLLGIAAAFATGATVFLLDGTAAKTALLLSLPVAALLCWRRRVVARIAAALSVVAILTSPLTLPLLADDPLVLRDADTVKTSLAHRFYIWDFTGKRIAERPLLGWGLDSARAIPGGKELIRLDQERLPLHPHNAPLQVWLELGVPAAVLFAQLLGRLWLRLGAASLRGGFGRQLRRYLRCAVSRLGDLAGMVAGDARSGGVYNHRDGARRRTCRQPAGYSAAAARVARLRSLMSKRCLRIEQLSNQNFVSDVEVRLILA
jgi:O-antigen ligase